VRDSESTLACGAGEQAKGAGGTVVHNLWPEFARTEHELPPEPDTMDKNTADLACRQGAGIEVTLLWHRRNGELTVSVTTQRQVLRSSCRSLLTRRSSPSTTLPRTPLSRSGLQGAPQRITMAAGPSEHGASVPWVHLHHPRLTAARSSGRLHLERQRQASGAVK
jgi:hypothetical protein